MRIYISVDMEGIAGVVHEDQTDPVDPQHAAEYNRFRRLMTAEANAAKLPTLTSVTAALYSRLRSQDASSPRKGPRPPARSMP
ncbi:MAG: M55 family metallopeptidase [Gemmatimonadales bacterium]